MTPVEVTSYLLEGVCNTVVHQTLSLPWGSPNLGPLVPPGGLSNSQQ